VQSPVSQTDGVGTGDAPSGVHQYAKRGKEGPMSIFYIIGVVVVVLFVLGYFGLR
jgi:hypothetical protein